MDRNTGKERTTQLEGKLRRERRNSNCPLQGNQLPLHLATSRQHANRPQPFKHKRPVQGRAIGRGYNDMQRNYANIREVSNVDNNPRGTRMDTRQNNTDETPTDVGVLQRDTTTPTTPPNVPSRNKVPDNQEKTKELDGINDANEDCICSRRSTTSPTLSHRRPKHHHEEFPLLEHVNEELTNVHNSGNTSPTKSSSPEEHRPDHQRDNWSSQSDRISLARCRESWRHSEAGMQRRSPHKRCNSTEHKIQTGKDGLQKSICHHGTRPINSNARVDTYTNRSQEKSPIPITSNSQHNDTLTYRGQGTRIEKPTTRQTTTTFESRGRRRRTPPPIPTRRHPNAETLPLIWGGQRREQPPSGTNQSTTREGGSDRGGVGRRRAAALTLSYLKGEDSPSTEAIQRALPILLTFQKRTLPIRPKDVHPLDYKKVLAIAPPHLHQQIHQYFRFLDDETAYPDSLPEAKPQVTGLSREDERLLADRYEVLTEPPLATTYGFKVAEIEKNRCRPVWSCSLNDEEFPTPPPRLTLHAYCDIMKIMDSCTHFLQLDGKSMYDQFPLHPKIQRYYAFKMHNNTTVALNRSPMGFKYSHGIAQLTSETLAYDTPTASPLEEHNIIHLDNFGLSWTRTGGANPREEENQIIQKITNIFNRANEVKFQFNEFSEEEVKTFLASTRDEKWQQLLPHIYSKDYNNDQFTFLGVKYALKKNGNTKQVSDKTIQKLKAVKEIVAQHTILPQASYRQIAMLIGLIRYCSKILEFNNENFGAYDETRLMAEKCQANIEVWDTQIGPRSARRLQPFVDITAKILQANPIRVRPKWDSENCITIFVDASKIGWGGIALYPDGTKRIAKGRWLNPSLWESSVKAEPQAIVEISRALQIPQHSKVIFATDHEGLVWASQATQIHTYSYFKAIRHLQDEKIHAIFTFIQGIINPADEPSRDMPSTATDDDLRVKGAAAGAGVAWALQFPSTHRVPDLLVHCGC